MNFTIPSLLLLSLAISAGLLASSTPARAYVLDISLQELIAMSEVIALAKVETVSGPENDRTAEATVLETLKGDPTKKLLFSASPSWTCDMADAEVGEVVMLFLDRKATEPVYDIAHSGRGRMEVKERNGKQRMVLSGASLFQPSSVGEASIGGAPADSISLEDLRTMITSLRDFTVTAGLMDAVYANLHLIHETDTVTMDPARRPGWCFLIHSPHDRPYEFYSVHRLPGVPASLTGEFGGVSKARGSEGLKTPVQEASGTTQDCSHFDEGDPLGEYQIDVFVDSRLIKTIRLNVVPK